MKFEIEAEGGYLHWVVRCVDKGKLVELHRFYRSADNFIYHRGEHGPRELDAQRALEERLRAHPELTAHIPELKVAEHSTMHVRQIQAGGSKRG